MWNYYVPRLGRLTLVIIHIEFVQGLIIKWKRFSSYRWIFDIPCIIGNISRRSCCSHFITPRWRCIAAYFRSKGTAGLDALATPKHECVHTQRHSCRPLHSKGAAIHEAWAISIRQDFHTSCVSFFTPRVGYRGSLDLDHLKASRWSFLYFKSAVDL